MRAGWLLLGLLACSRAERRVAPAEEPAVVASVAPRLGEPGGIPYPVSPPAPSGEPESGPPFIAFTHELPKLGKPGRLAFEMPQRLLVDEAGVVWRPAADSGQPFRVGHVPVRDVLKMRGFARRALHEPIENQFEHCNDCSGHDLLAYGVPGAKGRTLRLATLVAAQGPSSGSPELRAVINWLRTISTHATTVPRPQPFGLDLPAVALIEEPPSDRAPGRVVLELWAGRQSGTLLDEQGAVFRFRDHDRDRTTRRVGHIAAKELSRLTTAAEAAASEPLQAVEHHGQGISVVWFPASGAAAVRLSHEEKTSERFVGPNSDFVIAWMYALEEQTPAVYGFQVPEHWARRWPPRVAQAPR